MERLRTCLADYAAEIARFGPDRVVVAGTSAVRDAPNRHLVAAAVRETLGVDLHVLTGGQEADIAYRGAALSVPTGPRAVIDVGGGSTEIIAGGPAGPGPMVSLDIGGVRCTRGPMAADPPGAEAARGLFDRVRTAVADAAPALDHDGAVLGVAGTFTTLAALDLGAYSPDAVDGHRLVRDAIRRRAESLADLTIDERRGLPGLEPARAPVIAAGAVIVAAVADALDADEITVSERDLLDGLALSPLPETPRTS